jgi:hypothetical protein
MGLDQYAFIRKDNVEEREDVFYWRKHNRLHGWMEKLYQSKGGKEEFNMVDLELTLEDIGELEATILNKDLPETGGFFFGSDSYSDYEDKQYGYKDDDIRFIHQAKEILNNNKKLYYSCWW